MKAKTSIMKRLVAIFMAISLSFTMFIVPSDTVMAAEVTGVCGADGDYLTWILDEGILTISGTGAMKDYDSKTEVPWYAYADNITSVVINAGVTSIGKRVFVGYKNLNSVTIPAGVTSIGRDAFNSCTSLSSIDIPSSVTTIEMQAFNNCIGLNSVMLSPGLKKIGQSAFRGCTALSSISIPSTVESISGYAFDVCTGLTSITIPISVKSIQPGTFCECSNLSISVVPDNAYYTSVDGVLYNKNMTTLIAAPGVSGVFNIPASVTKVDNLAFAGCKELSSITIPSSVEKIEGYAFTGCTGLSSIEIPSSLTSIGTSAFSGCEGISSIAIPSSVTTIGTSAFKNCTGMTSLVYSSDSAENLATIMKDNQITTVIYPSSSADISAAFGDNQYADVTTQISYTENADGTVSLKVEKVSTDVTDGTASLSLPANIDGKDISAITYAEGIEAGNITISCTSHYLKTWGFDTDEHWMAECAVCGVVTELEKIVHNFGDGDDACECGYVPFTIEKISEPQQIVYGNQTTLSVTTNLTFGNEKITYQWYVNGTEISGATTATYVLPAKTKAGNYVYNCKISFNGYSKTENVAVSVAKKKIIVQADSKEKTVGEENPAFTFTVPEGALVSGDTTADWLVNLTTLATKDSEAGTYEIAGTITSANYEITVVSGVLTVNEKTEPTPELVSPKKGDKIKDAKKVAWYKVTKAGNKNGKVGTVEYLKPVSKKKKTVTIPATIKVDGIKYKVTSIAKNALKNNKYVTKVTIGKYVKIVGKNAFYKCTKLKTLTIGQGVTTIKSKAFYGCKKLKTITIKTKKLTAKKVGSNAFKGIHTNATIKVPKAKYKAYKTLLKKRGAGKKVKYKKI